MLVCNTYTQLITLECLSNGVNKYFDIALTLASGSHGHNYRR
jgi:hypothetical protein